MKYYLRRMNPIQPVNLRSFNQKARHSKRSFRRFLTKLENRQPRGLQSMVNKLDKEVWKEVDCLSCANCCKTMTPTYTEKDIKRISAYLGETVEEFKIKRIRRERGGDRDWINKTEPCQFLDMKTNMCGIYEVRPADCSGFPHLFKKFSDFAHIHKQNVDSCPATYKMVEKMMMHMNHPVKKNSL